MSFNNEIRLIGNLVKDPEEIATERGKFYIARIAVNSNAAKKQRLYSSILKSLAISVKISRKIQSTRAIE